MVDLADEKLEAEIEKLRTEISSLSAEKEKANQETEKFKIETKYAVRGFGYWFIEGLKIFAAGVLGFGGLTAAISGYTLGSAQKEMLLVEKEKAQKELKDVQSEVESAKKQLDNARTRKVVADYALGDALVQLELAKNKLKAAKTNSSDSAGASIDDAVAQTEKAKVSVENLK